MRRIGEQSDGRVQGMQRTAEGFAVQLRSDSPGVLEIPEYPNALVSIHIGRAARMSCGLPALAAMTIKYHFLPNRLTADRRGFAPRKVH